MHYDFTTVLNRADTGSTKWEEMKSFGITDPSVIPLSNAEMEFDNAPEIKQGLHRVLDSMLLSYYDPVPSYFEAVQNWFARRYDFHFDSSAILPNVSIHAALSTSIMALTEPGDGVLVMQPTWPGFLGCVRHTGRTLIDHELVEKDCVYSIDFDLLEKQLADSSCRLMLLCSPHNPIGRVWTREELEKIVELCCRYDVNIVSDEIHADLTLPGFTHIPIATVSAEAAERTITFTGASKAFNLAGLDTSNVIITNEELRKKYRQTRRSEGLSVPNMIGLKATELAYTKGEPWLNECVNVIADNAQLVYRFLKEELPEIRCTQLQATYLMWFDFRSLGLDIHTLENELMKNARLFVDDGFYFGKGGDLFERVNIACPKSVVETSLCRLRDWRAAL